MAVVVRGLRADGELERSAAFLAQLPAYAAHFRRTGVRPEQTWISASRMDELPALLGRWRDTVDEVALMPVTAREAGPLSELVDAAMAAWTS